MAENEGSTRRRFGRDLEMLADRTSGDGGRGMTYKQLGAKYGMHPESVRKTLAREDVRAVQRLWQEQMYEDHRAMGRDALEATQELIRRREPRTVDSYWRRMGVSVEPSPTVEVEEAIHIDAPPELLVAIKAVVGGPENEREEPAGQIPCAVHGCSARFPDAQTLCDHLKTHL